MSKQTNVIEKPADIVPAVQTKLHHLIEWLEKRRNDKLYINSAGAIEIEPKEMDQVITGLKGFAEALEFLSD